METMINVYKILIRKREGKKPLERPGRGSQHNVRMILGT